MEWLLAAHSISQGVSYDDATSEAHDRRHASAESRTEHANVLRATGLSIRTLFQYITRSVGAGGHPHLPGLPDQREETGAEFHSHRGLGAAFPLQSLPSQGLVFRGHDSGS